MSERVTCQFDLLHFKSVETMCGARRFPFIFIFLSAYLRSDLLMLRFGSGVDISACVQKL